MNEEIDLKQISLFKKFDTDTVNKLKEHMIVSEFNEGEIICEAANIGDCFYSILEGSVRAFVENKSGEEIVLARIDAGQYYGEQALFETYPEKSNPTIVALSNVKVMKLRHDDLVNVLHHDRRLKQAVKQIDEKQLTQQLTSLIDSFQLMNTTLAKSVSNTQKFSNREVIFSQGDEAEQAYYVLKGNVELRFFENEKLKSRVTIQPGLIFGAKSILENKSRMATAIAHDDVEVAVIDKQQLHKLCEELPDFHHLITKLSSVYSIPSIGVINQYKGSLFDKEAIITVYKLKDGENVIVSHAIKENMFALSRSNVKDPKKLNFSDGQHKREITIEDGKLVGVTSCGVWKDHANVTQLVLNAVLMDETAEQEFLQTGSIPLSVTQAAAPKEGILCDCMQVPYERVNELIAEGVKDVEGIASITGATTVCGACKPLLQELLGADAWQTAEIVDVKVHNSRIKSFHLKPISHTINQYQPGQYVVVQANINGNWIARTYTLTSVSDSLDYYEIAVKCEEKGLFSRWLFENAENKAIIRISEPGGKFVFDIKSSAPAVCFVGGIGVTPAIAFARSLCHAKSKRRLHIDYSVIKAEDFAFNKELDDLNDKLDNLTIYRRITDDEGLLTAEQIKKIVDENSDADVYVCGPIKFQELILKTLAEHGHDSNKIHNEEFTYAGGPLSLQPW